MDTTALISPHVSVLKCAHAVVLQSNYIMLTILVWCVGKFELHKKVQMSLMRQMRRRDDQCHQHSSSEKLFHYANASPRLRPSRLSLPSQSPPTGDTSGGERERGGWGQQGILQRRQLNMTCGTAASAVRCFSSTRSALLVDWKILHDGGGRRMSRVTGGGRKEA